MIERIFNIDNDIELKKQWDTLYLSSGADNLFVTWTWIRNWMTWFSQRQHVVLLNRTGNQLSSLGVFRREQGQYSFISTQHSCWPNILFAPDVRQVFTPFLDHFDEVGQTDRLILNGCSNDEDFRQRLADEVTDRYYLIRRNPHYTRSLDIADSMDAFLSSLPKKVRSELSRKHRKLKKAHPNVTLKAYDDPEDVDSVFRKIRNIEEDSWKSKSGTAIICSDQELGFYRSVLCFNESDIQGSAFFLESEQTPFAYVIGVVHKRRFYALKTSYQNRFADLAPGQVLFYCLIEHFSQTEPTVNVIELLGSDSRWKRELGSKERALCDVELLKKSLKSKIYTIAYDRIRPLTQQIAKINPRLEALQHTLRKCIKRILE